MPQMGESIAEGTIVRWIKHVGDTVERDEPMFEISTDKVDAEIPAPTAGVITEIKVKEGETVPVNSVVAVIGQAGEAGTTGPKAEQPSAAAPPPPTPEPPKRAQQTPSPQSKQQAPPASAARPASAAPPATSLEKGRAPAEGRQQRSSPLVRRIAGEHNVDLSEISGTGIAGRVTKHDILAHLGLDEVGEPVKAPATAPTPAAGAPKFKPGQSVEIVPMSVMRRKIAEHMVMSRRTSAHVHSVFEVNFSRVAQLREARKDEYEREGTKLTFLSFIARATVEALRAVPVLNASVDGENIVYKRDINLGIAVALDWGLIVPVIQGAHEKNLLGLSTAIADLASRARAKRLSPDDVQGGTFTITNPGVFGALLGMPIINQPQVAILGVGAVEKRPVVVGDAIGIRHMAYLTLGYDHRIIDGAVADQFMSKLKSILENFPEE
jgi:2-oxoglutarate dehydrogenase E2 component (dihydrolipoamide succinyltransferase)